MTDGAELQELLVSLEERQERQRRRDKRDLWRAGGLILITSVLFTILSVAGAWMANQMPNLPPAQIFFIRGMQASGSTALCPGEALEYDYQVVGQQPAVIDVDQTVWNVSPPPPQLLVPSSTLRAVLTQPINVRVHGTWLVPDQAIDIETGRLADWTPGQYQRSISISTVSRSTLPAIGSIGFTIREGCAK